MQAHETRLIIQSLRIEQNDMQTNLTGLDDHTSSALGVVAGPMGNLLEQNYLILNQYKQNMQQYKVHENTDLLVRFRDNIVTILSQMNCMSGESCLRFLQCLQHHGHKSWLTYYGTY